VISPKALALASDSLWDGQDKAGGRIVTVGWRPWPMTWPMFWLAQDGSRLPGTLSELRYLDEPTRTFRLPVAS
jgi:hypothetical protein